MIEFPKPYLDPENPRIVVMPIKMTDDTVLTIKVDIAAARKLVKDLQEIT